MALLDIVYGAKIFQTLGNSHNFSYDAIGKNSEVITLGDPLTISSGVVKVVSAVTDPIIGIANKTATMASNNQTVAMVTPGYDEIVGSDLYLMGTTSDMTGNATNGGTYYGLTGATGAVQVDSSSATTGVSRQVEIVQVDPFNIGGTGAGSGLRQVLVRFVKTPYIGIPTAS